MNFGGYLPNTPDDRGGLIVIFAVVGICWSLTVLVARIIGALSLRRGHLGWENVGIATSTGFGVASSTAVLVGVRFGLGQRQGLQRASDPVVDQKALYAADILYIFALAFSKLATLRLILGLKPVALHKKICRGLEGATAVWTIAAVFVIAIRCDVSSPWTSFTTRQCRNLFDRWAAIEAFSLLIEFLIFGVALVMILGLQMPRQKKLSAAVAFAVRLPVVIPTALRLHYLSVAFHSADYIHAATDMIIATQCNLHYSIMSASLSYLKPFLVAFDSNLGASTKINTVVSLSASDRREASAVSGGERMRSIVRPAPDKTLDEAKHDEFARGLRRGSDGSDAPIIVKTTTYQVQID